MKWLIISVLAVIPALAFSQTTISKEQALKCNANSIQLERTIKDLVDTVESAHSISSDLDEFISENEVTYETSVKISRLYAGLGQLWGNISLLTRYMEEGRQDLYDKCFNISIESSVLDEVCKDNKSKWCESFK